MSVAVWSGSLVAWERELVALKERIGPVFGRAETRATAGAFLDGVLSGVARKTGWLLAEQAGLERPYRMQSLLGRSHWDADALRDRGPRRSGRRAGGRRDRVPEEGRALGWGRAPVFRHGGADRKLSGRRVPGLCQPLRAGLDRPPSVSAGSLGPGREQAGQGRRAGGDHLRDQAADRLRIDRPSARCWRALCLVRFLQTLFGGRVCGIA